MQPGTWMKWGVFGERSRVPVYVFFVGEVRTGRPLDPFLYTFANGARFYADDKLHASFLPLDEHDTIPQLSDGRTRWTPTNIDEGERRVPGQPELAKAASASFLYAENFGVAGRRYPIE